MAGSSQNPSLPSVPLSTVKPFVALLVNETPVIVGLDARSMLAAAPVLLANVTLAIVGSLFSIRKPVPAACRIVLSVKLNSPPRTVTYPLDP